MKTWLATGLLASAVAVLAFQGLPRCTEVQPDSGKMGDVVTAKGENLDKNSIAEIYLTDGKDDTKLTVSQQTGSMIKFSVPELKPGRYHIAVLTVNRDKMIDQPVVFTVQ